MLLVCFILFVLSFCLFVFYVGLNLCALGCLFLVNMCKSVSCVGCFYDETKPLSLSFGATCSSQRSTSCSHDWLFLRGSECFNLATRIFKLAKLASLLSNSLWKHKSCLVLGSVLFLLVLSISHLTGKISGLFIDCTITLENTFSGFPISSIVMCP